MKMREIVINRSLFSLLWILNFASALAHPQSSTPNSITGASRFRSVPPLGSIGADNGCSNICQNVEGSESSILKYRENEIYRYKYEGVSSIHLPNSLKGENTKLNYLVNFDIIPESKCSFILRVSSVDIIGPDGKKHSDRSLLGHPARFSWNQGKLEKFCTDKQESITASNLKRSIISNLQISSFGSPLSRTSTADTTSHETDVYGRCQVTIEGSQEQDGSWIIKKHKDLNQCKYRQGFDFAVSSSSYVSDSPFQTNPFVQANLKSVTKVEKGLVKSVEVNEEYLYQPLTNYGDSQTSVLVSTKITLLGKSKNGNAFTSTNPIPSSLLFETEKSPNTETTVPTIVKAIQDASSLDESGVLPPDAAKAFSQFVSVLQQAKRTDILTTYAQVKSGAGFKNKDNAKSVFWDGLITAGTPATVETAATLLINNEMSADEISKFLTCLSFVKHPTEETLIIVSTLLDGPNVDVDRYLGVGALVRKYVLDHPNQESPELKTVLDKLTLPLLKSGISKTIEEEDKLLASLKGLRNAQYLTPNVSEAVRSIVNSKDATTRARVAALQTLMVNSSDDLNNKLALEILRTKDEDTELRINAFLAYINNPTPESAEIIKNLLDEEESDQVGSYITSFLKNLRTSTKPEKELLKQYYGDIRTNKKYPFDFRQYSQNYQFSQLFSALNLGYSAEADVIFSSQSYVPRSSSFSLNSYLFGNAFNLLEVDTRIENLEYIIEKFAGPRSYLQTTDAEDIADDVVDQVQSFAGQMAQKVASLGRNKRATKPSKIKQASKKKTPLSEKYIDLDLSFKMFESEVKWFNLHADKDNIASSNFMDILHKQIEAALNNAKNFDVDYKRYARSAILSNNVIYYPTSSGLPIKLSTDVNSVINFKMNGNADIPKIINRPKSAEIRLQIVPSAVLQADGMLEIDASVISTGLKASSSVRTATGFEISFVILDGQGFDLKVGLPVKEQDLFTLNTEAFTTIKERGQPAVEMQLKPAGKRYNYGGTFDQLSEITGLSLLAEVSSPAFSYKPTIGPGKLSLRLVKEDELLQYYQLKGYYDTKTSDFRSIELTFDTPGSSVNRKISLYADCNTTDQKITANFISPIKQIRFEGKGVHTDTEVSYHLKLNNDVAEYSADVGATITHNNDKTIYKPFLKLKTPNDARDASLSKVRMSPRQQTQLLNVDGQIIMETKKNAPKYRKYDFKDLSISSPIGKVSVNGPFYIDTTNPQFGTDILISYGEPKNTIMIKGNFDYIKSIDSEDEIIADFAVLPSQWPEYGFNYTMHTKTSPNVIERNFALIHGANLNDQVSKISLKQNLHIARSPKNGEITSMDGQIIVSYPLWKFNLDAGFEEKNYNYFVGNSALVMDRTNLELNGSLGIGNRKIGNIDAQLQSKLNEKSLSVTAIRELVDVDKSNLVINLNAKPGKQIVISADLTHALKPLNYVLRSESTVTVSPNKIYKHDIGLKYTPDEKSVHLMISPNNEKNVELRLSYVTPHPAIHAKGIAYIKNIIDGVANFEKENDKATGDLNINIIKANRLITGKLDLNVINDSNYQGYLELLWDASKDTSKKLKIVTNTVVTDNGFNLTTDNAVEFINYSFQANGNYSVSGEITNGTVSAGLDVSMPQGPRLGFQLNRVRSTNNRFTNYDANFNGHYYRTNNQAPVTVDFALKGRNIDVSNMMFDVIAEMVLNTTKTKNLKVGIAARNKMIKNIWSIGGQLLLDGSIIKNKTNLQFDTSFSNLIYNYGLLSKQTTTPPTTYHLIGSFGDSYYFDLDGKLEKSELSNTLLMRIPVKNQPFTLKYTGITELDISPSKNVLIKTSNVLVWEEKQFLNWEALFEVQPNFGKLNLVWETTGVNSRTLKMGYSYGLEQKDGLLGPFLLFTTNLTYDDKLANCMMKLEYDKDLTTRMMTLSGESPTSGQFYFQATNKLTDNNQNLYNEVTLRTINGKWVAVSMIKMYPTKPAIHLSYSSPEGESKFIMKFEEKIKNYWSGDTDVSWQHGGSGHFKADGEMKLDSHDDILIKLNIDAPIMDLRNLSFVATNVARKLKFDAKMMNIPIVSGTVSYIYQADDHKLNFEGDGIVKIQNKSRPITFKYNRNVLTSEANGENGNKNRLYLSLDNKKYVLDLEAVFTDKNFLLKRDLWHGDKCYKMDLSYNVKTIDSVNYEENILAHIDLKPFFQNGEEFTIEGKTTKSLSNYNNRMSLHWAPDKSIEYNMYSSIGKTGISFTLPKRQIAAETTYSYKMDALDGHIKFAGNVWFDKKRDENQKLLISFANEYNIPQDKSDFVMRSNVLFQVPTLPKTISITNDLQLSPYDVRTVDAKTVLDVFQTKEQAIIVTYQVNKQRKENGYLISDNLKLISVGQQLNAELNRSSLICLDHVDIHVGLNYMDYKNVKKVSSLDIELRLMSVSGQLQLMNVPLISGKAEIGFGSNYIEITDNLNLMNHNYGIITRLTTEPGVLMVVEWKGDVKQRVLLNTSFAFRQYLDVDVRLIDNAIAKVAAFTLFLDDAKFLTSKSEIFIDNLRIVLENGKKDLLSLIEDGRKSFKSISTDFNTQMAFRVGQYRRAAIEFKPVIESANNYIATVRDEIKNDPSLVNATQNVKKFVNSVTDSVMVFLQQISAFLGDWVYGYNILMNKLVEFIEKLVPELDGLYQSTVDDIAAWMKDLVNRYSQIVTNIIEYIKANKDNWREIAISAVDTFKDSFKTAYDTYEQLKTDVIDFIEKLKQYANSLPITSYLQEKLSQVMEFGYKENFVLLTGANLQLRNSPLPKYAWSVISEVGQGLKDSVPSPEFKNLIDSMLSFVDKILNDKPYDIKTEMKAIGLNLVESIKALIVAINNSNYVKDITDGNYDWPKFSFSSFKNVPNFWSASTSVINWIRDPDYTSLEEIFMQYKLGITNPIDMLPPFKRTAAIIDGQHIITFGGNYYQINGESQYLLAGDFGDNNFTLFGDIQNGKLNGMAVLSNTQSIEIFPDRMPNLDGRSVEFPVYGDGMYAIRTPYSIDIYVDNSLAVKCLPQFEVCTVEVSGFYQNKVYGLLGTVNSEKLMDYTMPDLSVSKNTQQFVRSYDIGNGTYSNPTIPDDIPRTEQCTEIFNGNSILSRGFSFINPQPYRNMCDRAVMQKKNNEDKLATACRAAIAYSLVSYANGYFLNLPSICGKCSINGDEVAYGYSTSVNVPQRKADIVIILEETKDNEAVYNDLLMKSIPSIKKSLADKRINDVNFVLIGYGPENVHPSIHTTKGKLTLDKNTKITFSDSPPKQPRSYLGKSVKNIKYFIGNYDSRKALQIANDYSYRSDAVKAIIQIKEGIDDLALDRYNIYSSIVNTIVSWNVISNKVPIFLVTALPQVESNINLSDVFGFDLRNVYTADGAKPMVNYLELFRMYKAAVILPLTSDGAVFNSSVFIDQTNKQSKLASVFTNTMVNSLTMYEKVSECYCKFKYGIYSEPRCSVVQTNLL